jgi:hypothetical protein
MAFFTVTAGKTSNLIQHIILLIMLSMFYLNIGIILHHYEDISEVYLMYKAF